MRKVVIALLLLAATSAAAQVVSSTEQSYGPYTRPAADAYLGITASHHRILLAWSEINDAVSRSRVRIGLLDFQGRLVSPIETISAESGVSAYAPLVASDGDGFAVLYSEIGNGPAKVLRVAVDATGHVTGSPGVLYTSSEPARSVELFWSGTSYVAYINNSPNSFTADGTPIVTAFGAFHHSALTVANGKLAAAGWTPFDLWGPPCLPHFGGCTYYGRMHDLFWFSGNRSDTYRPKNMPLATGSSAVPPVVGTYGTDTIVAWRGFYGISYYVIDDIPREVAAGTNVDPSQQIAIACDPKLCLLAYGTFFGDIHALAIDVSHKDTPTLLQVATSVRREWHPQVQKIADGRFLIAYYSDLPGDTRFAGRIVSMPPSRTRSVGK